ncbi:ABC transporter permease [Hazenella sp. IB182357]|uniref:ABC transporter permease n=1 Tax=Polycladospora coralii TaxID=2771432 RepID=A0A926RTK4_9BACL|nr:ABC transporter permease [Polycladospora coralii]MBD1371803.1 ABC transporter permease [Polycladospora coralii]MBS7529264.1 ABC transporter permease [Polycladospora coralii]
MKQMITLEKGAQSTHHARFLRKYRLQNLSVWIARLTLLFLLIGGWEWASQKGYIDPFLFSSPTLILKEAQHLIQEGVFFTHILQTFLETTVGFLGGTLLGIILATIIWASPFLSKVLDPYLVVLNSLPKVALGPIFIVTLGAGFVSIIAMAIAITIIITTLVIYNSFQTVDPNYLRLVRSFGANRFQLYRLIIFPACIPNMIAALKVNVGLAWVGVIVGEFLVSKAGLGYLIIYGFQVFNLHLVMMSLAIIAILATLMYQAIAFIEHRFKHI